MMRILRASVLTLLLFVSQGWPGSVHLHWVNPTELEDGTPLTDLAGVLVAYGPDPGQYTVEVDAGLSTSAVLSGLAGGQEYFFAVRAYRANGVRSEYSAEVSTIVGSDPRPCRGKTCHPTKGHRSCVD